MGQACDMCEGTSSDVVIKSRKQTESSSHDKSPLLSPPSQNLPSVSPPPPLDHDAKLSNEIAVYDGWKNALETNNESLAMYLFEDNGHEYNLLEYVFGNGDRALHTAVNKNNHKMILFLLSSGAMVNSQNQNTGNTALHYSVMSNHMNIVTVLLKFHADPSIANFDNKLPIDLCNNNDIKELLSPRATYLFQKGKTESDDALHKNSSSTPSPLSTATLSSPTNAITTEQQTKLISPKPQNQSNSQPMGRATTLLNDDLEDILGIDPTLDDGMSKHNQNKGIKTDEDFNDNELANFNKKKNEIRALVDEQHLTTVIPINEGIDKIGTRDTSKSITRVASKKLLETMQTIHQEQKKLPTLAAWLEKRKPTPPHQWQKRWVVVKDSHMLWSDKQRDINDTSNPQERKKFNHSISLMVIEDVKPYDSKSGNKFIVVARDAKKKGNREFIWKAISQEDRDYWIKGLNEHRKHIQSMLDYLGNK